MTIRNHFSCSSSSGAAKAFHRLFRGGRQKGVPPTRVCVARVEPGPSAERASCCRTESASRQDRAWLGGRSGERSPRSGRQAWRSSSDQIERCKMMGQNPGRKSGPGAYEMAHPRGGWSILRVIASAFKWLRDFFAMPGNVRKLADALKSEVDRRLICRSCGTGRVGTLTSEIGMGGPVVFGTCALCGLEWTLSPDSRALSHPRTRRVTSLL